MGLQCIISDPFKREHKRQRLSELENETQELRRRLSQRESWAGPPIVTPPATLEAGMQRMPPMQNGHSVPPTRVQTLVSPPTTETNEEQPPPTPLLTQSQSLEGVTLPPNVIDELFKVFFDHFHQFIPILDTHLVPNEVYQKSPFLFWAITGTASRNFQKDPTLFDCLGDKVLDMALMGLRKPQIPTIEGLLLILTWPIPRSAGTTDVTYAIAGSLLHMAIQNGLHIPTSSQDFSRVKVNLTDAEIKKRAVLWGYCVLTYQRTCALKGHAPLALVETYQDVDQRQALFSRITPTLRFQLKLNSMVVRCTSAVLQNGLRSMSKDQEHSLDVLIRVFEASMRDIERETTSELDTFYLYVARLSIQAFHLYRTPSKTFPTFLLTRMYTSACLVLRHIDRMDSEGMIRLAAAPWFFVFATSLSTFIILRLLKASTASYLDDSAKDTFFLGVNIMKRLSAESNDMPARLTIMLTQLWNSEKAFKSADGSESIHLRIRTRLVMGPVFDAIWWWREEFGGQPGAYDAASTKVGVPEPAVQVETSNTAETTNLPVNSFESGNNKNNSLPGQFHEITNFLDDQFLAELGWTTNANYLYQPGMFGGFGSENWYSPTDLNGFAV
ncbi:hypothetical protein, variant 1 [Verruconis gallopava]|nr:hypothetical protein, variant 1 [Verruconis gallopava]KIW00446.1 hypothetical protein, variant 1 [Verruconis gallopava]